MNLRNNPRLRDQLAAAYALGTLRGGARRRLQTLMRDDAALRQNVAEWTERLAAMAQLPAPVTPPARVWNGIEQRLGHARAPGWQFWRRGALGLWQGATAVAALALVGVLVMRTPDVGPARVDQLAVLVDESGRAAVTVLADSRQGTLSVRTAAGLQVADDRTLQLWAITGAGATRSLGVLPDNVSAQLALNARAVGPDVAALAVSLEPKGGSPNPNAPTGPVLYKSSWVKLRGA
ncbi:MAG: anti-sigma factor domain-containing protein [Gammaproteobacteria bacterium]